MSLQKISISQIPFLPMNVASKQNDSFLTRFFQKIIEALLNVFSCCKKKTSNHVTYQQPAPNPVPPAPINQVEQRPAQNPAPLPQVGVDPAPANHIPENPAPLPPQHVPAPGELVIPVMENSVLDVVNLQNGQLYAAQYAQYVRAIEDAATREIQHIQQAINARPAIEDMERHQRFQRTNVLLGLIEGNIYSEHPRLDALRPQLPPGAHPMTFWSYEVDQMICMLNAACRGANERNPRTDILFAEELLRWKREGLIPNGLLAVPEVVAQRQAAAPRVLEHRQFAQNPKQAARETLDHRSNQAVARAPVLAAIYHDNISDLIAQTIHFSEVTHNNADSVACSVAVNVAIALLLNGVRDKNTIWRLSKDFGLAAFAKKLDELNLRAVHARTFDDERMPRTFDELERFLIGGVDVDSPFRSMAAGFAALSEAMDDVERGILPNLAVSRALDKVNELGGDAKRVYSAIAGSMLGAAFEQGAMPRFANQDLYDPQRRLKNNAMVQIDEIRTIYQRNRE